MGKTDGHDGSSVAVPSLNEALSEMRRKLTEDVETQQLVKACHATTQKSLRLRLSYGRIAMEEGVAAMEGRAIAESKRQTTKQTCGVG